MCSVNKWNFHCSRNILKGYYTWTDESLKGFDASQSSMNEESLKKILPKISKKSYIKHYESFVSPPMKKHQLEKALENVQRTESWKFSSLEKVQYEKYGNRIFWRREYKNLIFGHLHLQVHTNEKDNKILKWSI